MNDKKEKYADKVEILRLLTHRVCDYKIISQSMTLKVTHILAFIYRFACASWLPCVSCIPWGGCLCTYSEINATHL